MTKLKIQGSIWSGKLKLHKLNKVYILDTYANSDDANISITLNSRIDFFCLIGYFMIFTILGIILFFILDYFNIINNINDKIDLYKLFKEVASKLSFILATFIIGIISDEKISVIISLYILLFFYNSNYKLNLPNNIDISNIGFLSLRIYLTLGNIRVAIVIFIFIILLYPLYKLMKFIAYFIFYIIDDLVKYLDKFEKRYILVVVGIVLLLLTVTYYNTSAFSYGYKIGDNGNKIRVGGDVIYGFDHSWILSAYTDITGQSRLYSIRHPLINIVQLIVATMLLPINILFKPFSVQISAFVSAFINALFMILSSILLKRIIKNNWIAILYSVSYFFIILCLGTEQYQISIYFIILSIYMYMKPSESTYRLFSNIMMSGTTLTSGGLIPVLAYNKIKKKWIKNICYYSMYFLVFITVLGKLSPLYIKDIASISSYKGEYSLIKNLYCFTNFVRDMLLYPAKAHPIQVIYTDVYKINMYTANIEEYKNISVVGVLIIIICLISMYKNINSKIIHICIYNIIISFILNVIIGWSQGEHWLYVILFSWSYIILIIKFIESYFGKYKNHIYIMTFFVLAFANFSELSKVFDFAVKYYIP